SAPGGGTAALLGALREGRRGAVRTGGRDGTRGHRGQESRRPVHERPLGPVAEDTRRQDRGFRRRGLHRAQGQPGRVRGASPGGVRRRNRDRKSTRLNSSHVEISYAVFCLKKKKKKKIIYYSEIRKHKR